MKAFTKSTLSMTLAAAALVGLSWQAAGAAGDCRSSAAPGIDWQNCDKKLLMLEGSSLRDAKLGGSDFTATDLRNTDLAGANLEKARLIRASLAGATATGARFVRVEAYRTNFSKINAEAANFENAELQRSDFRNAQLSKANFTKAELGRSQFEDAELGGSRFSLANLARANFRGAKFSAPADFDRAFLFLARVEDADLSTATGLSQSQLDMACGNGNTVLPAGLKAPANWPCKFEQD